MRKEDISQESWLCFFLERQVGCCLLHIDGSDIIRAPRGVWIAIRHGMPGSGLQSADWSRGIRQWGAGGVRFYNRGA